MDQLKNELDNELDKSQEQDGCTAVCMAGSRGPHRWTQQVAPRPLEQSRRLEETRNIRRHADSEAPHRRLRVGDR